MYYYILNPSSGHGAATKLQDKLRTRLTELGIGGEFAKTTGPGDATKMTRSAIQRGYNTIVVIGGDETVSDAMNGVTNDSVAVGIIPLGNSNQLATHLGIHSWQQACEVLAARRIATCNLVAAGQAVFVASLHLNTSRSDTSCSLAIDGVYQLESPLTQLNVTNLAFTQPQAAHRLAVDITGPVPSRPLSQRLWGLAGMRKDKPVIASSRILARKLTISTSHPADVVADGRLIGHTPISIHVTTRQIRLISEKRAHLQKSARLA